MVTEGMDPPEKKASDPPKDYIVTNTGEILTFDTYCDVYKRPLSDSELYALISRYAFVEMRNPISQEPDNIEPVIFKSRAGWDIYDYGQRVVILPGRRRFGAFSSREEDGEGGGECGGFTGQAIHTIVEALMLIMERWGASVDITAGHYSLSRLLWMIGTRMEMEVFGFNATPFDYAARDRIRVSEERIGKQQQSQLKSK